MLTPKLTLLLFALFLASLWFLIELSGEAVRTFKMNRNYLDKINKH